MITFSESQQKIADALEAVSLAHWIDNHDGTISCSHCNTWFHKDDRYSLRYCTYCGCFMSEGEKE